MLTNRHFSLPQVSLSSHNRILVGSLATAAKCQMVERRLLTATFVDSVTLPNRGERWIADTRLRGFGLRLWRSTGGEGKAFAIRAIDTKGRQIRRTYDGEARNEYFPPHQRRTLGDALDSARDWAADELCRAKGRPTLREEEDDHRKRISKRLS